MKLYTETEAFADALKSIVNSGKRLDRSIQRFAVSAILHAVVHGNVCHVNDLVANMPKGSRVNAVREWFTAFGPVEYNSKSKEFDLDKAAAAEGRAEIKLGSELPLDISASIFTPWTDFSPEPKYTPIDFTVMIQKAVALAQKRLDDDEGRGDKIDADLLTAVKALVETD